MTILFVDTIPLSMTSHMAIVSQYLVNLRSSLRALIMGDVANAHGTGKKLLTEKIELSRYWEDFGLLV